MYRTYFYHPIHNLVEKNNNGFWGWDGWTALATIATAVSAIIMALTLWAIWRQIKESKKLTLFTVMPTALRSARTAYNLKLREHQNLSYIPDNDLPNDWSMEKKLKTWFIIKNDSKFTIRFHLKITFYVQGEQQPVINSHWKDPLIVCPGRAEYPQVFELSNFIEKMDWKKENKTIVANFQFKYAPIFAPDQESPIMPERWIFKLGKFEWEAANGVRDIGLAQSI